ncbi:MAG: GNAT family N-acetyltransferase [Anaerolineales bacterium]|nr:MAG: GNAT family N-acetyltransferase [Anaerolineales bacterium]
MKILETNRLLLRHLIMDDLNELFALYSDPEIRKYFPEGVLNYEETKEELEWHMNGHPRRPELGLWATIHKETGKFIGRCGLLPWTLDGQDEVEIAYLLDKAYWKQGLATEAAQDILQYGFEQLNLSRLICMIDPENIASQRVAERIGMTFERKVDGYEGDNIPFYIYSIARKE